MQKLQIKETTIHTHGSILHVIPPGCMNYISLSVHNEGNIRSSMKLSISTSGEKLVYLSRRLLSVSYGTVLVNSMGEKIGIFSRELTNNFDYIDEELSTDTNGTITTNNVSAGDIIIYDSLVLLVDHTLTIQKKGISINGFLKSSISNASYYGNLTTSKERTPLHTDVIINSKTGGVSTVYTDDCFITSAHTGYDGIFVIGPNMSVNDQIFTQDGLLVGTVVDLDRRPNAIDDPLAITFTTRPSPAPAIPVLVNFPVAAPSDSPRCLIASGGDNLLTAWGHYVVV